MVSRRVAITQALELARLEIAAEAEARKTMTRADAQDLSDQHLSQALRKSIAEAEAGLGIPFAEAMDSIFKRIEDRKQQERDNPPPLRKQLKELAQHFHTHSVLSEDLARQALFGPDTHFIPFEHWPAIACEAAKRLALPYHDVELSKCIRALLRLYLEE